ncbi:MAG TPA: tripartite tricarboxylate transporter substrate binding protein [Microlunatus sp.]
MKSFKPAHVALAAFSLLGLAACQGGADSGAPAGAYKPKGNVTMVVPFSAGGGSDQSGRAIAGGLEDITKGNITVENREGGSGAVGYSYFLSQKGNDRVLLATETAMLALPLTQKVEFSYKDFTPIMKVADDYTLVVVGKDSPYNTCTDVVGAAKSGRVVAAVSGATSLDEVVFTLIEKNQSVKFDRVPFESGGEVLAALLGKKIDVASLNPSEVSGQLEAGDLKALCAVSDKRYTYPSIAAVPTAKEQGIDVAFAQFRGFIAPGDISPEAKEYWINAAKEFEKSPAYTEYIEKNLLQANPAYGDDFTAYLDGNNAELQQSLTK